MPSATFVAKYTSPCDACGADIEIGEEATFPAGGGDNAVHVRCPESAEPAPKAEVCTGCWQTKSNSGHCGCYEDGSW